MLHLVGNISKGIYQKLLSEIKNLRITQLVATASTLHMCARNVSVRIPFDELVTLAKLFYGSSQPLQYNVVIVSRKVHTRLQLLYSSTGTSQTPSMIRGLGCRHRQIPNQNSAQAAHLQLISLLYWSLPAELYCYNSSSQQRRPLFLNHFFFLYHCPCRLCIRGYYLTSAE